MSMQKAGGSICVTVVVPVYNCAQYVERCLESVCLQGEGIEVICVDDGSTDESADIVMRLANRFDCLTVIRKENGGLSSARNAGIERANGEYVVFIDSDDYLRPGALNSLYERAVQNKLDILYYDADVEYEDGELARDFSGDVNYFHRRNSHEGVRCGRQLLVDLYRDGGWCVSAVLQLIRRELFEKVDLHFRDGVLNEDNYFTVRAMFRAQRVEHVNDCWYVRCLRHGSIMTSGISSAALRGNFRAYWDVSTFISRQSDLTSDEYEAMDDFIGFLRGRTKNYYEWLISHEQDPFLEFTLGERFAFEQTLRPFINSEQERISAECAQREADDARAWSHEVEHSTSFRVGSVITAIPRYFKDLANRDR